MSRMRNRYHQIPLECHPRPKYMTVRLKEMKDRMKRIVYYMLKDIPEDQRMGHITQLKEIMKKIQSLSLDNILVQITGDNPGLIERRDLIKKSPSNSGSHSREKKETGSLSKGSIFTFAIKGQEAITKLQTRLEEFADPDVLHPIYVIEAVDAERVATELRRILKSVKIMDKLDARYFIVQAPPRPASSSEPAEKMVASDDAGQPSTRPVTRASAAALQASEASSLRHKSPSAPDQSKNMSRLQISPTERSPDVSPLDTPVSSPVSSPGASPQRPERTRHVTGSRKKPFTRKRARMFSQGDPDDQMNVDDVSAASTSGEAAVRVHVIAARSDDVTDNQSWGEGGDIAAAITNQVENNVFDLLEEILKLAEAIRKALPMKEDEGKTGTVLDRFIFEVESLMTLSNTRRGQLRQKRDRERVQVFQKLQKDILRMDQVVGCGTIFGTLHVHTKPEMDDNNEMGDSGERLKEEVEKLIRRNDYSQLGFERFKVETVTWTPFRRTVEVVH